MERNTFRERIEVGEKPPAGRYLDERIVEMEQLAVQAEGQQVPCRADRQVLRDLEAILIHGGRRAHRVGTGDEETTVRVDLNERERTVRLARVEQALITHDDFVLRLAPQVRAPDQACRVSRGSAPAGDGREGGRIERAARIDEVTTVPVRVVVRELQVSVGAQLDRDLSEGVLGRQMSLGRPRCSRFETKRIGENVLEFDGARLADGGARDLCGKWSSVGHNGCCRSTFRKK